MLDIKNKKFRTQNNLIHNGMEYIYKEFDSNNNICYTCKVRVLEIQQILKLSFIKMKIINHKESGKSNGYKIFYGIVSDSDSCRWKLYETT